MRNDLQELGFDRLADLGDTAKRATSEYHDAADRMAEKIAKTKGIEVGCRVKVNKSPLSGKVVAIQLRQTITSTTGIVPGTPPESLVNVYVRHVRGQVCYSLALLTPEQEPDLPPAA